MQISGRLNGVQNNNKVSGAVASMKPQQPQPQVYTSLPSTREILGQIQTVYKRDQAAGTQYATQFYNLMQDPTSPYYQTYARPTNQAAARLASYGIDTSNINDDWFKKYSYLGNYLRYDGNTNTPSTPKKKSSIEEKQAYEYYQLLLAEEQTKKVEEQWKKLQRDLSYWAQRSDLNYSDDEIIDRIDWKQYSDLEKLTKQNDLEKPVELNRGTTFSKDAMYATIWAARNGGGSGDVYRDMASSALGEGNVWSYNEDIDKKRNANDKSTYSRYSLGMTLEDEGAYFGRAYFDDESIEEIRKSLNYNDPTEVKYFNNILTANEKTNQADEQLKKLNEKVEEWKKMKLPEERITAKIDELLEEPEYNILSQMNESLESGGKLVGTTRAVDFNRRSILAGVHDYYAEKEARANRHYDYLAEMNADIPYSPAQEQLDDLLTKRSATVAASLWGGYTPIEKRKFMYSPWVTNGAQPLAEAFYRAKQGRLVQGPANEQLKDENWVATMAAKQALKANDNYMMTALDTLKVRSKYEDYEKKAQDLETKLQQIDDKYGDYMLSQKEIPEVATVELENGLKVTYRRDADGKYRYHQSDNNLEYYLDAQEYMDKNGLSQEDLLKELAQSPARDRLNDYARSIEEARAKTYEGDMSGVPSEEDYLRMRDTLNDYNAYLDKHKDEYDKASKELKRADNRRTRIGDVTFNQSGIRIDPKIADDVVEYISAFADWTPPKPRTDSVVSELHDTYISNGAQPEDIEGMKADIAKIDASISNTQYLLDNYQDIPKDFRNSMTGYIEQLNQEKRLMNDYLYSCSESFKADAERGRAEYMNRVAEDVDVGSRPKNAGITKFGFEQMTDLEKDIFFATYATKGIEEADRFYKDIEGNLSARVDANIEQGTKELAESGAPGRVLNEVVSIGLTGVEVYANAAYMLQEALGGEGNIWLRKPSKLAQEANKATIAELNRIYKDTPWDGVWSGLAEMVNNRGRSMMANYAAGWMIPDIPIKWLNDPAHAAPIALIAMADAYDEAKDAGLEEWQCWTLGGVNFLCESLTEGIEFGHYSEVFKGPVTLQTFGEYWAGKLVGLDWLSEMTGEVANNKLERAFDRWIAGEKGENARRIQEYIDAGLADTEDEAAMMVQADYIKEDMHTAVISALGSFLDVGTFAGVKLLNTAQYVSELRSLRKAGDTETTISDLRNRDRKLFEIASKLSEQADTRAEQEAEEGPSIDPTKASPEMQKTQQVEYDTDMTILENARDADNEVTTSTLAAVLRTGEDNAEQAEAAAEALREILGDDTVDTIEDLLAGGLVAGTNINSLKMAIQFAATADGQCRQILMSQEFADAMPDAKAQMLAESVIQDAMNAKVQTEVQDTVRESRIAAVEQRLMAEGDAQSKLDAVDADAKAKADARKEAETNLENQRGVEAAKGEATRVAGEEAAANPTNDNVNRAAAAAREQAKAAEVTQQMEQHLENTQKGEEEAKQKAEQTKEEVRVDIRAQAEQIVAQEDQQRAEELAQREAAAQQAQQETEARWNEQNQAEAQQEAEQNLSLEDQIKQKLQESNIVGEDADAIRQRMMERLDSLKRGKEDMTTRIGDVDGDKFIRKISRKTGLPITMVDLGDPIAKRGYIQDGKIVLNSNLSKGQALVEAAFHEVTHGLETTEAYKPYRDFVLQQLYGGEGTEAYNKAIRDKIDDYARSGITLDPVGAEKELVAEYGRLNLASKGFAKALATNGLAGKVRQAIRRALQTLKGYTLNGPERQELENLKAAEKLLTNAINERARTVKQAQAGHTGITQFSITGVSQAAGLTVETNDAYDPDGEGSPYKYILKDANGNEIEPGKFTTDMVNGTPVGNLVNMTLQLRLGDLDAALKKGKISQKEYVDQTIQANKTAKEQKQFITDIVNMIGQFQDAAMVWELAGSMAFSSLKANSDKQYGDSYDFGTICKKTQAILNVISETQLRLGRGLTKDEIDGVIYEEVGKGVYDEKTGKWRNGLTPCPVCYVYSHWVVRPARSELARQFREECKDWTDEQINELMSKKDPTQDDKRKQMWVSYCLADKHTDKQTKEVTWTRKANPELCPNEVLLDMRKIGDLATKYPGTWTFIQRGGTQMGKTITSYSDSRLGETIVGKAKGAESIGKTMLTDAQRKEANPDYIPQFVNPFLTGDKETAMKYLTTAIQKARKQNLKGGQRWQSWSDFRAEWGSDYLMEMFTMQALGAKVQTYTKVVEAIDMMASAGFEVNLSGMPYGDGFWHNEDGSIKVDEDGNLMLRFSPVTGIDGDAAKDYVKKYAKKGNVQLMTVGISDQHIQAALASDDVTFVIPFHGSGGSVARVQHLMRLLKEKLDTGNDYTQVQSDKFESGDVNTNPNWALRIVILTGKYDELNDQQKAAIADNEYLNKLYQDRYVNEDSDAYHIWFDEDENEALQIYPYEYWDKNTTLATADKNSDRFIKYCQMLGVIPRFSGINSSKKTGSDFYTPEQYGIATKVVRNKNGQVIQYEYGNFSGREVDPVTKEVTYHPVPGYWKLLIDRSMYNRAYTPEGKLDRENSTYHEPQAVNVADINVGAMPQAANNVGYEDNEVDQITERTVRRLEMTSGQNAAAGSMADMAENAKIVEDATYDGGDPGTTTQHSIGGPMTLAELDQMLSRMTVEEMEEYAMENFGFSLSDPDTTDTTVDEEEYDEDEEPVTEEKVREVITAAVEDLKKEFDPTIYNGKLYLRPDTLEYWLGDSGFANSSMDYSKAYLAWMNPKDFVRMTTTRPEQQQRIFDEAVPLNNGTDRFGDAASLSNYSQYQPIQLQFNEDTGKIDGHEGRHRATALARAGVTQIPVFLVDDRDENNAKYNKKPHDELTLEGQNPEFDDTVANGNTLTFHDVIPVSTRNRDELFARFTATDEERQAAADNQQRILEYSQGGDLSDAEIDDLILNMGLAIPQDLGRTSMPPNPNAKQRQFGRYTAQWSEALHQKTKDWLWNHSEYNPETNLEQIDRAIKWVQGNASEFDQTGYLTSVGLVCSDDFDHMSADGQARMLTVMSMAAQMGDSASELRIADAYNKAGTDLGRALQARQIFRLMTPTGRKQWANQQLESLEKEFGTRGVKVDLRLSQGALDEMANADTEEKLKAAKKRVRDELAKQVPPTWKERIQAWRMFSMLGNPRTHLRNILGNAVFVPVVGLKNRIGATMEGTAQHFGWIDASQRSKTWRAATAEQKAFAKDDLQAIVDTLTGESKYDDRTKLQQSRAIFGTKDNLLSQTLGKLVQKGSDYSSKKLEQEDLIFLSGHYVRALSSWMAAQGYSPEDMVNIPQALQNGRAYAIREAQKATYRDLNAFSSWLNKGSKLKGVGWAVDAVMPFKKTPANILKRGLEYSPVGLAKSLTYDIRKLQQWGQRQRGDLKVKPDGAISPTEYIDRLASGASGTIIMGIGMLFKALGLATGSLDDPEDEFDKLKGEQEYALRIPGVGSFTFDWAAPVCMPFFVGVELMQELGDGITLEEALSAAAAISEPVFNLSMMDGLSSLFRTSQYDETDEIAQIGIKVATNYLTSMVPTLLGQAARTIDPYRRKAYVESGKGIANTWLYAYEQTQNKIPFWSMTNIPYRDSWGNVQESSGWKRAFENFISPGYFKQLTSDEVADELERLFEKTGDQHLILKDVSKTVSVGGESHRLTDQQYDEIKMKRGQLEHQLLSDMMDSTYWDAIDDGERVAVVKDIREYANTMTMKEVFPDAKKLTGWVLGGRKDPTTVLINRSQDRIKEEAYAGWIDEALRATKAGDAARIDQCITRVEELGGKKSEIKKVITDEYKEAYQIAWQDNDEDVMRDIYRILDGTGLYSENDLDKWIESVTKYTE